jgi:hypothetical protein
MTEPTPTPQDLPPHFSGVTFNKAIAWERALAGITHQGTVARSGDGLAKARAYWVWTTGQDSAAWKAGLGGWGVDQEFAGYAVLVGLVEFGNFFPQYDWCAPEKGCLGLTFGQSGAGMLGMIERRGTTVDSFLATERTKSGGPSGGPK